MERYMYQDDSFERMLKQKADEYRMYPAEDSWHKIQQKIRSKNNFNWKGAAFLTTIFVSLSLYVSTNQDYLATVKNSTPATVSEKKIKTVSFTKVSAPGLKARNTGNTIAKANINKPQTSVPVITETILTTEEIKTKLVSTELLSKEINEVILEEKTSTTVAKLTTTLQAYKLTSLLPSID